MLATILLTALLTLAVVIVVANVTGPEKKVQQLVQHRFDVTDPQFRREMGVMLGPPVLTGNRVRHLRNGEEIFPAMIAAIAAARRSIAFETYIYWSGEVGQRFSDALSERARAGVQVHVTLDWVGSNKMDARLIDGMKQAGVQVERYRPLRWYNLDRINHRTHRKLLVIDGATAFTGGVGIADQWQGHAQDPGHWRDSHFLIEGPAAAQMQAAFGDNWVKMTGRVLHGPSYYPALSRHGDMDAQVFLSSPSGGSESMHLMYLMSIAAASRSIDLAAAYFVPDELTQRALLEARERGVRVRILVPGEHIDSDAVRLASKAQWGPLLRQGVELYEYRPTMMHVKLLIVDRHLVSVGSTNFDSRSFQLNDEASLNVYESGFADEMTRVFEDDLSQAKPYTYQAWTNRPWTEKAMERFVLPIKSQL
ncbi:phospholipase D family protein [Lysobacter capsici]|uniref:phospholipase D-like domain-containing protein n=1 Tax=Lysobacter capsici TaxID=435897 RepID=UPI0007164F65|nr:phospholipase D-like domain-containing protein [Lysobacter capsici]ALN84829.1 phospholipase D family protein [Lysobacter capsici]WND82098.1 phospholipase D-like domain-containing protein [Lysobacter capsici]WND87293.1 phospholipase D-like domain-containing protein [Lysobacter capsici]